MTDSLFDGRYRYDYIYPRGRSGETLRAVDTAAGDRPVVIKRPAPNDAPPIRAGQEVSILNERRALTRVGTHPVATALLGGGQFVVGGIAHQYIVLERAEGAVVAEMVSELAARGERLPELEMLVIVDSLLDLLAAAHAQDIVYNDVDAKHLFWERDAYRLKVIDWGNAVFLEGDESTAQGISRQSDIFQVGELLYFLTTGGARLDVPRDAGDDFRADFGHEAERVSARLQTIISRAGHPNPRLRYRSIADLRKDLADYRAPLERERSTIVTRVGERLRRDRSRDELTSLFKALEPALAVDPGYPAARDLQRDILDRLSDLEVAADLDAVRIYLQSANWARAANLLDELRARARGETARLVALLLDWAKLLLDADVQPSPPAVLDAVNLAFQGESAAIAHAAYLLITAPGEARDDARKLQLLLAERISAHHGELLLLRPNLYRLEAALAQLDAEDIPVTEPRALLAEVTAALNRPPDTAVSLIDLRDRFRRMVDDLAALNTLVEAVNASYKLPNRKLPLSSLDRALNAAMALADNMHVIGKQATASPRDALAALDNSRAIDPGNPLWDAVARLLDSLYELLGAFQVYIPAADGSDLEGWLAASQRDLQPFVERLFDEMLVSMVRGLDSSGRAWAAYAAAIIQGNRLGAVSGLAQAADAVTLVSPSLAGWLNQLRSVVAGSQYVERHALFGGLGRALADGWENFDRGRLADAEQLGQRALEIARSDPERFAARRLRDLSEAARGWSERNGVADLKRTSAVLAAVESLYTLEEHSARDQFAAQMPSKETYLKAMGKGLVEQFTRSSTAAPRILFLNYVLLGALDAHDDQLDDAAFWRDAADRVLGETGARHPSMRTLDEFIERRRDLIAAAAVLNRIDSRAALPTLEHTRRSLEDNSQARLLAPILQGLRELEAAVRDWSDGEFRAAGNKLENTLKALDDTESLASITLTNLRAYLQTLLAGAAELHASARQMNQLIEARGAEPKDSVRAAHHRQVSLTTELLGDAYAATLRSWRDTYEAFLAAYTDRSLRRSARLGRFNDLFRAMFIDRHPAYPLYRHWYDVTDNAPEFPAPPTDEPTPRITEGEAVSAPTSTIRPPREHPAMREPEAAEPPSAGGAVKRRRRVPILALGALILIAALVALALALNGAPPSVTPTAVAAAQTSEAAAVVTDEPTPSATRRPPASPTPLPSPLFDAVTRTVISIALSPTASSTPAVSATPSATATFTPVPETPTPSATPTITATPTATLPPEGLTGQQDVLALIGSLAASPWEGELFSRSAEPGSWRLGLGTQPETDASLLVIPLPADLLDSAYGANAAGRLISFEATLTLTTFNPALLVENEVFFGALLQTVDGVQSAGLQVQVPQPGVVALAQRQNEAVQVIGQRSVTAVVARLRLERDANGAVRAFFNNEQIGEAMALAGSGTPVVPALFVRNGGVIISVTEWRVDLQ